MEYVFAYSRDLKATETVSVSPADLGFASDVYVYDYFGKTGWRQPAEREITRAVDSQGSYFVIAPIGLSGMAFLGDVSRFVPASRQRVGSLTDNGQIMVTLELLPGETVPISVFAAATPVMSADGATVSAPVLDASSGLYQVSVKAGPGQGGAATIRIAAGG